MGAENILKDYFELDDLSHTPSSVAHGVDMNHLYSPLDCESAEPIHWCHNEEIYYRASKIKPSFRAPHPFLIKSRGMQCLAQDRGLVIGPPPSKENNFRLLELLKLHNIKDASILLKYRGDMTESINFWKDNGYDIETAGIADNLFYDRLIEIFKKYKNIYSANLSSALFFGSSFGCNIYIIENYFYKSYEVANYLDLTDKTSLGYRDYVIALRSQDQTIIQTLSNKILGHDFFELRHQHMKEYLNISASLESGVHFNNNISIINRKIRILLATIFQKQSFLTKTLLEIMKSKINQQVFLFESNDFGFWGGIDEDKYMKSSHVNFDKGNTEPGKGAN